MVPQVATRSGWMVAVSVGSRMSLPSIVAFSRAPVSSGPRPTLPVIIVLGPPKRTSAWASASTANPLARPRSKLALAPHAGHAGAVVVVVLVVVVVVVVAVIEVVVVVVLATVVVVVTGSVAEDVVVVEGV